MSKELIAEVRSLYGDQLIEEVLMIVSTSDPDGAFTLFEDMGMYEHAEAVEMIYFFK